MQDHHMRESRGRWASLADFRPLLCLGVTAGGWGFSPAACTRPWHCLATPKQQWVAAMAAAACSPSLALAQQGSACARAARRGAAARALPKQLGAGLGVATLLALPARAEPTPFGGDGSGVALPAVSIPDLPAISLPAVDLPDLSGLNLDGIDPLWVAAGAALLGVPLGLAALLGGGSDGKAKAVPAPTALQVRRLGGAQLRCVHGCGLGTRRPRCALPPLGAARIIPVHGLRRLTAVPTPGRCRPWRRTPAACCWTSAARRRRGRLGGPT